MLKDVKSLITQQLFKQINKQKTKSNGYEVYGTINSASLGICTRGLHSGAFFETRRDGTGGHFLNSQDQDGTTYVWSCCSGQFGENSGKIRDGTGLLRTTWEISEWS